MSTAKLQREKAFHDIAFSEGTRDSASKFYSIIGPAQKFHQDYLLARCAAKHVLEYGCGPGTNAFVLARQAATVTGIDISDVAIAQARERAQREHVPNVVFQVMDAENPTLPDDTYDLISGRSIIHHLDLHKAFFQLARIMARDGSAILYEPLGHNPFINLYRRLTPKLRTPDEHPLLLSDLDVAAQYFDHVEPHFFTLSPLLAVPFRRMRGFHKLVELLHAADQRVFRIASPVRKYAWQIILVLSRPKKVPTDRALSA